MRLTLLLAVLALFTLLASTMGSSDTDHCVCLCSCCTNGMDECHPIANGTFLVYDCAYCTVRLCHINGANVCNALTKLTPICTVPAGLVSKFMVFAYIAILSLLVVFGVAKEYIWVHIKRRMTA